MWKGDPVFKPYCHSVGKASCPSFPCEGNNGTERRRSLTSPVVREREARSCEASTKDSPLLVEGT